MPKPTWKVVDRPRSATDSLPPLAPQTSAVTRRAYEIIAEAGRIRREEVMVAIMPLIPAGMAYRANETARRGQHSQGKRRHAPEQRAMQRDMATLVGYGRRAKATVALYGILKTGRVILETDEDGVKWLRINPDYQIKPVDRSQSSKKGWRHRREAELSATSE